MKITPPPDVVVFDFDGPIIDSREPVRIALSGALQQHGYPSRTDAELDSAIGPPTLEGLAALTGEPESSPGLVAVADSYHRNYGAVYLERTRLVDGIGLVLRELPARLALATSKEREFVEPLLEALAIGACFEAICAPTIDRPESKRQLVARALGQLGAERAAVVGDRRFDIEAARACGAVAIGVSWGIGDLDELREAGAEVIVDTPTQLLATLGGA